MSDGARLHELWASALEDASGKLAELMKSTGWTRVGPTIHRKGAVFRAVFDIGGDEVEGGVPRIDDWRAVFGAPELRREWDPLVDKAQLLELLDPNTRVSKTDYALGWPANPRDAITISRTIHDETTLIDISTSLPRSPDEPAYLRPSPPSVRSHVHLFAWCIQLPIAPTTTTRITLFWQHDLRNAWPLTSSTPTSTLPALLPALYTTVSNRAPRAPLLHRWGSRVVVNLATYDPGRAALRLDYTILPEEEDHIQPTGAGEIELWLSASHAWEAQLSTRAASDRLANLPWSVQAARSDTGAGERTVVRVTHAPVPAHSSSAVKVKLVIELGAGSPGTLRLNGAPHPVSPARPSPRANPSFTIAPRVGLDILSTLATSKPADGSPVLGGRPGSIISTPTVTQSRAPSISSSSQPFPTSLSRSRPAGVNKAIQTLIRRSYTYFTALLQEPDQKWRPLLESRGVTVTQLDSIDPTLVVFRAEATFVGVGVWDILGALGCEPARAVWEKSVEDVKLVEDVNELTELWWVKHRAAWPVNPRDTLLLKTSYKSPTSAHVFSFSTSDTTLFPNLPPPTLPTIRAYIDLHGFAIEALSPTTTLLTLLEQSSGGWSARPAGMVQTLAGIGEMVIRGGGAPPVVSRLSGGRKTRVRYEHERGMFRVEYERSEGRGSAAAPEVESVQRKRRSRDDASIRSVRSRSLARDSDDGGDEGDELGASVATVVPNRSSPLSRTISSSPDSISRTSLALSESSASVGAGGGGGIVFPSLGDSSGNNSSTTLTNGGAPTSTADPTSTPPPPIELELRIDPDTWSPLELVVDPPPSSVRALRRHRLARGGGGLWVTVEHAVEQLAGGDERISVVVRKGGREGTPSLAGTPKELVKEGEGEEPPMRTAREELLKLRPVPERSMTTSTLAAPVRAPTLIVNGARVKVDVEELAEGEARALAREKRVKPARVPLDEPPVLRTRRRVNTNATMDPGTDSPAEPKLETESAPGTDSEDPNGGGGGLKAVVNWGMGMGSLGLGMGGLGKMWAPAGSVGAGTNPSPEDSPASAPGTVLGLSGPDVQSGVETVVTSVAQPSSLLRLVTNTSAPASSMPTSIPGDRPAVASALDALSFLTKQHAANSTPDSIPTADGWTPVNTKAGLTVTRRTEPSFSSVLPVHRCAKVLQGVSAEDVAGAITCAGSRRQWDTWFDGGASAVLEEYGAGARTEFTVLKGGFPFRDRGFYLSSLTARTNARGSKHAPTLIFLASSSYTPDAAQQFSPSKVNPYGLPVGQMPLYGWVIETLDPYTAENYAIPSARCTLYVCVDYGGQVPVAYNAMVNATLPRASIAGVEAYLGAGARASVPVVRYPASVLGVVGQSEEEAAKDKRGEGVWVLENEDPRRTFLGSSYNQTTNVFQASVLLSPYTPRTRTPTSPIMPASAIEPSSGSTLLTATSRRRKVSAGAGSVSGSASGSGASWGRAAGANARMGIPRIRSGTLSATDNLTVAEFIVDSRLFPGGYDITTASMFLSEGSAQPVPLLVPDSTSTTRALPLQVSVYTVPLSPLRASATTPTLPTRQLIRLTLPMAPYTTPEVLDPLTGETRRGPEQPEWLKRLAVEQAVVRVSIGPGAIKDKMRVDGSIVEALSEKKSVVALGRAALEEEHVPGSSVLGRVKNGDPSQKVPNSFLSPVAAAIHLYSDEPIVRPAPVVTAERLVQEPASAEAPVSEDGIILGAAKSPPRPTPSRRPSASAIFGFLSAYTNPMGRTPATADSPTDVKLPAVPTPAPPTLPSIPEPAVVELEVVVPAQHFMFDPRHSSVTLLIVALIAFLIGSLLRSLISPADFIFMGSTSPNEQLTADEWRQVKRLVEFKYAWWGWDFVVAVVRRP